MPINTTNFDLFKYDVDADANSTFNITKALNDNWDKLDANVSNKDLSNLSEAGLEVIKQNSGAEWGSITGGLTNQTDLQSALDLKADKSELTKYNTAYITNVWVSGKSYYILFSNKFCMQGGFSAKSSGENINFFKKMANTNFNLQITAINGYAASGWESLSTTGFVRSADTYDAFWRVEGYVV